MNQPMQMLRRACAVRRGAAFVVLLAFTWLVTGCGPVWVVDPGFAERQAKQESKPILWYFKSWDSSQHRNMRLQVFANSAVASEMTGIINVELEFAFFQDYRNRYGVKTPQVCVMCTPDGRKVGTSMYVNPVPTPEKFVEWLRASKAEAKAGPPAAPTGAPPPPAKK